MAGGASENGDAVIFASMGSFAGMQWGGTGFHPYVSRRKGDDWTTTSVFPPPLTSVGAFTFRVDALSPAFERSIISAVVPLTGDSVAAENFYRHDTATGALDLFAPSGILAGPSGISRDLDHVAFVTSDVLDTGEPDLPDSSTAKVYEATPSGTRLVSRQPDGSAFAVPAALGGASFSNLLANPVSDDGRHIFFSAGTDVDQTIYRRTSGEETLLASPSERAEPDPEGVGAKVFRVATDDGNRVFFTSVERLTDDANDRDGNGDLYRYDLSSDDLVNLSAGTPGTAAANVSGVLGISDAGDRAYFVANGQVVEGDGSVPFEPNLYLWEEDGTPDGSTRFIGTLSSVDQDAWDWDVLRNSQVTDDGRFLVFPSVANLTAYDAGGTSQVYRYDAESNGGAGGIVCVSCSGAGTPPAGSATVPIQLTNGAKLGGVQPRLVSQNGRRVLFTTPNALLPGDTNGALDAYLWQDGGPVLLSSGRSGDPSYAFSLGADGRDAFFRTREALVPVDDDTLVDLYTARIGGGLASQLVSRRPDCEGEGCQPPSPGSPAPAVPPTVGNESKGNVVPRANCGRFSRAAKRSTRQARKLRGAARKADSRRYATTLRRRATRLSKQAKRQRAKARACTQRNRGAGR